MINKVILCGNLTRDPELRSTAGGTNVLSFSLAVNERVKNADGEWADRPSYIDCTFFGKRAEGLSRFMRKGMKVCAEGKLRLNQWEKDGQKRSKLEVIVDEVEFVSPRAEGSESRSEGRFEAVPATLYDDEIPF